MNIHASLHIPGIFALIIIMHGCVMQLSCKMLWCNLSLSHFSTFETSMEYRQFIIDWDQIIVRERDTWHHACKNLFLNTRPR